MDLAALFPKERQPSMADIAACIANPLFDRFIHELERKYGVSPSIEYSRCQMAMGWNVKYKKGGRPLCTIYPCEGAFTVLAVVGSREAERAEWLLPTMDGHIQSLYAKAMPYNGGRWLMIDVASEAILRDTLALIDLRMAKK